MRIEDARTADVEEEDAIMVDEEQEVSLLRKPWQMWCRRMS